VTERCARTDRPHKLAFLCLVLNGTQDGGPLACADHVSGRDGGI
jgi:hypothetical protein